MMRRRGADVIWRSSWVVDQDWLARGSKPHRDSKWMVEEWLVSESTSLRVRSSPTSETDNIYIDRAFVLCRARGDV